GAGGQNRPDHHRGLHAAGLAADDDAGRKLDKLEALLCKGVDDPAQAAPLVAGLLGIEVGDRYPPLDLTPQQRRSRTMQALVDQLVGLATKRPVLLLLEDAHWIDPTTRELIELSLDRITDCSALVLITARPTSEQGLGDHPRVESLAVGRMERNDGEAIIGRIAGGRALPREVLDDILDKADGVPLFIEELTRTVLDSGALPKTDAGYTIDGQIASLAVPSSLHDSLVARLDRLQPIKRVAQAAACIGREFSYELLAAISPEPEAKLRDALDELADAELIFTRGTPAMARYTFKHALVRDAAYQLLLRGQREDLHRRIAEVLLERFPDTVASQPEFLARHYTEAGMTGPAVEYWHRAGAHAVARSAHREAVGHFERALELLTKLPPGDERDERELELRLALAVPLAPVFGTGSGKLEEIAARTKELSEKTPNHHHRFVAHRLAWNCCLMRQPVPKTADLARELMDVARNAKDPAQLAIAHRALGYSLFAAGEQRQSAETFARGVTLADRIPDSEFAAYGEHPGMVCRAYGSQASFIMGFPETGAALADAAVAHARQRLNAVSLAWALCVTGSAYSYPLEAAIAARLLTEGIEIAREHRLTQWITFGEAFKGWAIYRLGDHRAGLTALENGVRDVYATGAKFTTTLMETNIADSYLRLGDPAAARPHLAAARAHLDHYGETFVAAELCRLEALVLQTEGATRAAIEDRLDEALRIGSEQEARLFELRSATALAQLWAECGERQKAYDLLAPIYAGFTEGFHFEDLRRASSLLDQLGN
ncbi:MAG: hypothetical protein JOZ17_00600, partial [Acetobacteraceae bacterium]|nr:hypothetical protein [Acetobacteraceae bacterium]